MSLFSSISENTYLLLIIEAFLLILAGFAIYRLIVLRKVHKSKVHLQAAFDSIEDPLAVVNDNYTLIRVNDAYRKLVKKHYFEISGKYCYEILRQRNAPCDDCKLAKSLHSNRHQCIQQSAHPT